MACELAAHRPDRVSKMILLDPIGLWREDIPVASYMLMSPEKLVATSVQGSVLGAGAEGSANAGRSR